MGSERVSTSVRFRQGRFRAVEEVAALLGGISREEAIHLILGKGLAVMYAELGIERDPAETAAELLRTVAATWGGDLSDDEQAALAVTGKVLERITQVRARETEDR
jgi:hypothetical protein